MVKAYNELYEPIAAREKCKADGSHLPTPRSEAENAWYRNYAAKLNIDYFWLGIDDANVEGEWRTETGDLQTFFKWDSEDGQPNNWKEQDKESHLL